MALSLTDEQTELAASVKELASKRADLAQTRSGLDQWQAGDQGPLWKEIVEQGLPALHLPEEVEGMGGTLADLAVAVEAAGEALLPGAFVPAVFASALAQQAGAGHEVLARFAEGAIGAVVAGALSAPSGRVSGTGDPALGALAAEVFVALVPGEDGYDVYLVEAADAAVAAAEGIDLTRDVATVTFEDAAAAQLGSVSEATRTALIGAIYGAEASGLCRTALASALEYAHTRQQFGVAIGTFQATKHKAARMAVAIELAASAAWGAATSLSQDEDQQTLAGASADLVALKPAPHTITDAVTIFGGIGFTWEHDIHLFLRRAMSIAGLNGSAGRLEQQLGGAALGAQRIMDIDLPDEDPSFRAEIGALLDQALTMPDDTPRFEGSGGEYFARGPRREFLADNGLISPHWPAPWGRAASATEQVIIDQEFAARDLSRYDTIIGEWAMPTILAHGTEAQKEQFARATLTADVIWCQLFSEPEAGSDLASLRTRATKVDGGWRLDGQKVWNSNAQHADWGICLARTDAEAPKHRGISFFLVEMSTPGITVLPLKQSNADTHFTEVFLDDVFVPDECLVGAPNEGWRISMTTLQNERTSIGTSLSVGLEDGIRAAIENEAYDDRGEAVAALGRLTALSTAIGSMNRAETLRRLSGLEPGAGGSLAKVATAELTRVAADAGLAVAGARTVLASSPGEPTQRELVLPQALTGGGTVEIQLNVIAERVLGLPRR